MKLTILLLLVSLCAHAQVKENYKDSASKYWQLSVAYTDSTETHRKLKNWPLARYFYRKESEARAKSFHYAEKQ